MAEVSIELFQAQLERVLAELRDAREERGAIRDDIAVATAKLERLDSKVQRALDRMRARRRERGEEREEPADG